MIKMIPILALVTTFSGVVAKPAMAQVASFQLTNPAIDAIPGEQAAAWVADENLGVLYCELVTHAAAKRVECYDGNGKISPSKEMPGRP